jgi:hypothetical protein
MAELNDRAREHSEEAHRLLGGDGGSRPITDSATYWNPAGVVVYEYYSSSYGGGWSYGPTETLPDVSPNHVLHSGTTGAGGTTFTTIDLWTQPPWEGWKAVLIITMGLGDSLSG